MSTLLSELDSAPAAGDGDFVQSILNEMNANGQGAALPSPIQPPPAVGGGAGQMIPAALPPTALAPRVMDSGPITAHMIGASQPTPADFANMMGSGAGPQAAPQAAGGGGDQWGAAYTPGPQPRYTPPAPKRSWLGRAAEEVKGAVAVAMLVFIFSLPVVNFLFAHYLPSMVKPSGELTVVGLLIKSFAAAGAFWTIQRVIVPLLSL